MKHHPFFSTRRRLLVVALAVLCGTALTIYELNAAASRVLTAQETRQTVQDDTAGTSVSMTVERSPEDAAQSDTDSSAETLADCVAALEAVQKQLENVDDYSATFVIRERIGTELTERQRVALQIRHEPFSVRMKWIDEGREVVFIQGQNDDQLVVKPGGLASLIGTVKLDPQGDTAMAKSRYPITEAGMLSLVQKLLKYQKPMLKNATGVQCVRSSERCENLECDCFVVTYRDADICDGYARTTLHVDKKSKLLVSIRNDRFDASSETGTTFVEHYVFTDVQPDVGFTDDDFTLARSGLSGRLQTAVTQRNITR